MSFHIIVTLAAIFNLVSGQAPAAPAAPAAAADGAPLTVNTPTSVQACLPVALSWTGGTPPVYVSLIKGGEPTSPILKDFGPQKGNSLTWDVDQPAGASLTVQIRDSQGKLNYSDKFQVQSSTQTCKSGDSSASGGSASKPGSSPTSGNTTPATGSTPSGSSTGSTTSSSTPATSTTPGNANTAATNSSSPAAQAGQSDASRATPGFIALAMASVLTVFA